MSNTFRPDLLTKEIAYCQRESCAKATQCLRHLAFRHSASFGVHEFVDPREPASEEGCRHFLGNQTQRMAAGFKRAMRMVASGSLAYFQTRVGHRLNCGRTLFYEYARGARLLNLEQQTLVRSEFETFDIKLGEELFDRYVEAYVLPY